MFSLKVKKINTVFLTCLFLLTPILVLAQPSTPPAGIVYECTRGAPGECTFDDVITAIQHVLNWARNFALMFSVIVIAYAGWKIMISGDKPAERVAAKNMLVKVVIGIILMMAAWLIVTLILNALGVNNVVKFG